MRIAVFILLGLLALNCSASDLTELSAALAVNNLQRVHAVEQQLLAGPASEDTLLNAGAALAQHDMLPDAARVFAKCMQRFPDSFEAKYNLALARVGLNDYRAAEQVLSSASPRSPRESAALKYLKGKVYAATGRPAQAIQFLQAAYKANPQEENYALDLALLYLRSYAYVPAIEVLKASLARHPDSEELSLELALANALAGRRAESLTLCAKLRREQPDLSTPILIAAFVNCAAADYPACEAEAAAGLSRPKPDPYFYYLHSEALWNSSSQNRAEMLSELNAAVSRMPRCSVCLLLRSRVLDGEGNESAAIADLKAALAHNPQLAQAWYRLSVLYRNAGQTEEAADAVRHYRALQQRQEDAEVNAFREQLLGNVNRPSN